MSVWQQGDPTKATRIVLSYDPAVDRESMGDAAFAEHFGLEVGADGRMTSKGRGTRSEDLLRFRDSAVPVWWHIRPLTDRHMRWIEQQQSAEARWVWSARMALTHIDNHLGVAGQQWRPTEPDATETPRGGETVPRIVGDDDARYVASAYGLAALYEVGAVAYARAMLGPFAARRHALPATSLHVLTT